MERSGSNFSHLLDDDSVILGFTTRFNGVSENGFKSLNLAFHVGDKFTDVMRNRAIFCSKFNGDLKNFIFLNQIHKSQICVVDDEFLSSFEKKSKQFFEKNFKYCNEAKFDYNFQNTELKNKNFDQIQTEYLKTFPTADSIITNLRGVGICVMVADCSPILIYDKKHFAIAAVHAGRAGVCDRILSKTVEKMAQIYGSKAKDLQIWVGANIKGDCYEVGALDFGEFAKYKKQGKFDMDAALKAELNELGVKEFHFETACSHCDERYFSYRRDKVTGRFVGYAMLRA